MANSREPEVPVLPYARLCRLQDLSSAAQGDPETVLNWTVPLPCLVSFTLSVLVTLDI